MTSARGHRSVGSSLAILVIGLCLPLPLISCRGPAPVREVEFGGPSMGSTWSVKLVPGTRELSAGERDAIDRTLRDQLTRIEGLMSTYDAASELSRFNRSRSLEPFPVARETFDVFAWAVALARETDGALDVTVLPILHAWGFGAAAQGRGNSPPDEGTLAHLKGSTGINLIELDPEGAWVRKRKPEVECDFSALAPGYAADRLADVLEPYNLAGFLIDVGGELVARGRNAEGLPWRVAVERPQAEARQVARVVPLDNLAIATSGDYRNYREVDGHRVGHIIDPRTARPVDHRLASATVVASSCVRADALATALMVLGPDEGLALAHRLDIAALLLVRTDRGFEARSTPRFDELAGTGN